MQAIVTPLSAWLPAAALDVLIASVVAGAVWALWRAQSTRRWLTLIVTLLAVAAGFWLTFLGLWGWHYQVPTLEARLAIGPDDLAPPRGEAFAAATVAQLNALHGEAHATAWPSRDQLPAALQPSLARVLPALGVPGAPVLPSPRRTLLDGYFRAAGIDGMTNPFGLEVIVNSRLLPVELPALTAHEYAHLAGFADESDAGVVAWLVCQDGSAAFRYSGALAVLPHLVAGLPRDVRRRVLASLEEGPRADLEAIAARLAEQRPWVHALAWTSYDRFLRANRVSEGVARYDAVARVLIGAADPATGRLRRTVPVWPPSR